MNKRGKSWHFFAMAELIIAFSLSALFGFSYQYGDTKTTYVKGAADIRFGIDIRGGVDVTFMPADDMDATDALGAAYCHFLQLNRPVSQAHYKGWKDFINHNQNRICRKKENLYFREVCILRMVQIRHCLWMRPYSSMSPQQSLFCLSSLLAVNAAFWCSRVILWKKAS